MVKNIVFLGIFLLTIGGWSKTDTLPVKSQFKAAASQMISDDLLDVSAYDVLCWRQPSAVVCSGGAGGKLAFSEIWAIDSAVRADFSYRSDMRLYGREDFWTIDRTLGDCEDYALRVSEELHSAGEAGDNMALILWMPEPEIAHATLLVETKDGGQVELGVGRFERPHQIDWDEGDRVAVLWMNGKKEFTPAPGKLWANIAREPQE